MTDSIHEYVLTKLQEHKGRWPAVSKATGISRRTIEKIARQEVRDPGVSLIERLCRHFQRQEGEASRAVPSPRVRAGAAR